MRGKPVQPAAHARLLLLIGTAATIGCPTAIAEDFFETDYGSLDLYSDNFGADISSQAPDKAPPEYIAVSASSLYETEDASFDISPPDYRQDVFYTLDDVPPPANAESASRIDEFNRQLAQIVTIELNANFGDISLGTLTVETTLSDVVSVDAAQLQDVLDPLVDSTTALLLSQFEDGFVSVERLQAIGVEARLNQATLTLNIDAPAKPNGPIEHNLGGRNAPVGTVTARPSNIAAGLTSTLLVSQDMGDDGNATVTSAVSGFVNLGGVRGLNLDFGGIFTLDDGAGNTGYQEDRTILFIDRPERALRFEAGTLLSPLTGLAGQSDFLGIGVTKSYRDLQPTRVLRPLGQRSFQLERASEVLVLVDGQVISRFDAPAGPINLNDIPLANTSNRVSIVVEDEFGRRELENFSIASDAFLLEPGFTEYSFGIGQERDQSELGFNYTDRTVASGKFQYGVTSNLTTGGFGYVSDDLAVIGSESVIGALNGITRLELGYSDSDLSGEGFASSIDYRWASAPAKGPSQNIALALDYRDKAFTSAGSRFASSTKFEASAFYERQITDNVRINVAGAFSEEHDTGAIAESLSIGTSYQFGRYQFGAGARIGSISGQDEEIGAFFTITRRLGNRSSVNARYDTLNDRSSVTYRRPSRNEVGSVGLEGELLNRDRDLTLRGAVDYTANRYRTRFGVSQDSNNEQLDGDATLTGRLQTGIAFADGKFGIGRDPGRGFVMVGRHESLDDAQAQINSRGRSGLRASSGLFGPAIARVNSPFVPITTRVDIADAPIGYNVGEGSYYSVPGARSAIKITVGTDAYRSVAASFNADGEPLALAAGTLTHKTTGVTQVTFTNSRGRALLSNLEPGTYTLDFAGTDYRFEFEIDANSETFSNLGSIDLSLEETP